MDSAIRRIILSLLTITLGLSVAPAYPAENTPSWSSAIQKLSPHIVAGALTLGALYWVYTYQVDHPRKIKAIRDRVQSRDVHHTALSLRQDEIALKALMPAFVAARADVLAANLFDGDRCRYCNRQAQRTFHNDQRCKSCFLNYAKREFGDSFWAYIYQPNLIDILDTWCLIKQRQRALVMPA